MLKIFEMADHTNKIPKTSQQYRLGNKATSKGTIIEYLFICLRFLEEKTF